MSEPRPPSKFYILAAALIAVVIWAVLGVPGSEHGTKPAWEVARNTLLHR